MPQQMTNPSANCIRFAMACAALILFCAYGTLQADSGTYKSSKHGSPVIGANRDFNLPRGNCSQCHLQHDGDYPHDFALFAAPDNALCQSSGCHEYQYQWPSGDYHWSYPGDVPDWYNSGHGSSSSLFPPGTGREVRLCVQCHNPHAQGDSIHGIYPSATNTLEERGCYSNGGLPGQGCHGFNSSTRPPGAADIYSQLLKSSKHNVEAAAKVHSSDWQQGYPYGREPRTTNSGALSGSNRHAECVDCHNPHMANPTARLIGTGEIGGSLLGAWGVEPNNAGPWSTPTSFSSVDITSISGSREYQLCLKCHSYFAFGDNPPNGYTDIAREINPANLSFHPLEDTIPQNSYTSPSQENGFIETLESPWDNGSHDRMACSDCHASETPGDPRGPHGSNQPHILIASPAAGETELCLKCHKAAVYAPLFDPGGQETGSRFDRQTSDADASSHYFHVTVRQIGCRQCYAARQTAPPASPEQRTPYPVQYGSAHGANTFVGFMNGANISAYSPGNCTPTCHAPVTYNGGPE